MVSPKSSINIADVAVDDEFWSPWIRRNRDVTIEYQYDQLEESGTLENFRRTAAGETGGFQGMWFQDSDAYKWLEAASYELAKTDDGDLRERVHEVIKLVGDAQRDDGYVNTYFQLVEPENRWTNLNMMHELYCGGHLIEGAVAHYRATGERSLLDLGISFANHVDDIFGDEIDGVPGHEEIELALVKLYHVTGEERYLDRAQYFVDLRGHDDRLAWEFDHLDEIAGNVHNTGVWNDSIAEGAMNVFLEDGEYDGSYAQAHTPIREQNTVEGHSVRAMYLFAAVTDLIAETDDEELWAAMERLWENMTTKRMYVTGGIGPEHEHEGFTDDYDLPNETAYAETCAAIGSIFWNQRLLDYTGKAKYADLVEEILYNGMLAGVGLDGKQFFYVNPLESDGDHHRKGWFTCACCPPNAARLLASLGHYLYSARGGELYVNQYIGSTLSTEVDGVNVELNQESMLPWGGKVIIEIETDSVLPLNVRVPNWCNDARLTINGAEIDYDDPGFVRFDREWNNDTLEIDIDQSVELLAAHPKVEADIGRVAVARPPLVYCAEEVDNDRALYQYEVSSDAEMTVNHHSNLIEGVSVIGAESQVPVLEGWEGKLYRPSEETDTEHTKLQLIPYYAWDNRKAGTMQVWHRLDRS